MVYTNRFDENSDLTMTYLGQTKMTRETRIKVKEKFPITGQGFTLGRLLDGTECQILLDMGANHYVYRFSEALMGCIKNYGQTHLILLQLS